jgi:hypothetical protein
MSVKLTAALLVLLWVPASSHEWLEMAGLIHFSEHVENDASHDAADGVCRLDASHVVVQPPSSAVQSLSTALLVEVISATISAEPAIEIHPHRSTAPPELRTTWQFSERTALPSRAPSTVA